MVHFSEQAVVTRVMTMRLKPGDFSDAEKRQALLDAIAVGEGGLAKRLAAMWGNDIGAD